MLGGFSKENYTFPFVNNTGQTFENKESLLSFITDNFGNENSQSLYYSTLYNSPLNLLYDQWTQEMISRYFYCKEFNTSPYPGDYESLPCDWLEFVNIISAEIPKIQKEMARKNGKKSN